ncbi:2-hydroxychromene-2-carboxylate isomerase/DsbA-like thioredoxin domain [Candidatus Phaeomarinobacter ectocarpi]|uniref:2-hydroxychromene-2-carboxylate isomerase/DsbA-like thioredoxin domain n=1 Tax=Candidatus Phaeomarinibacter ectocarpi TaxID=1458461 RepID=X5MET9_9HYPH|nr:DsbA family oxidoreductase [Candidatus Phaeomarinobacter ectocarpi]CDO61137.1 2-hydroxychromene-2-carboxylate isomerase/DsbA-like thioredoxin domain [Candidatus Phaeomarinobacter ectocarpi]
MFIDVVSDTVCPWCYIGKRRFDMAKAERPDIEIDLRWRPYQLDPTIPAEGVDRREYMEAKFGKNRSKEVGNVIREAADEAGITLAFDKIQRSPNTFDSHRLIRWGASAGAQNEIVEILFRRYFEDGEDIGDRKVLVDAAKEAAMDHELVAYLLLHNKDADLVANEANQAREMGISGVPTFLFEGKFAVVGAQETEGYLRAIDKVQAKLSEQAAQ